MLASHLLAGLALLGGAPVPTVALAAIAPTPAPAVATAQSASSGRPAAVRDTAAADTVAAPMSPGSAADSVLQAVLQRFEQRLAADVAADGVGSVAAAVVVGDSVVWSGAFGTANADRAPPVPAAAGTIYRIGSLTKPLTAAVLMRLVERGEIGLDDPVETHLPELRRLADLGADRPPVTWRQLASHTAGLDREPLASHAGRGPFRQWKRKLVDALPLTRAVSSPGAAYRYSNIGYAALGFALERATGVPYEWLLQELVLDPLDMGRSYLIVPQRERGRLATGFVNLPGDTADPRVPRAEHRGRGYRVPGEGLYSTVGDMARFVMAMTGALGDGVLSASIRAEMLRVQTPGDPRAGYGIGLQLTDLGTARLAGHSGTVAGYAAYMVFDPETRVGVVLLRNYNFGETNLAADAQRLVLELTGR